ncbi:MAG: hypothetical protein WBN39_13195, partial [Flavobacteriaceae bacterium]
AAPPHGPLPERSAGSNPVPGNPRSAESLLSGPKTKKEPANAVGEGAVPCSPTPWAASQAKRGKQSRPREPKIGRKLAFSVTDQKRACQHIWQRGLALQPPPLWRLPKRSAGSNPLTRVEITPEFQYFYWIGSIYARFH